MEAGHAPTTEQEYSIDFLARYGIETYILDSLTTNGYSKVESTMGVTKRDLSRDTGLTGAEIDRVKVARRHFFLDVPRRPDKGNDNDQSRDGRTIELLWHFGVTAVQTRSLQDSGYHYFCHIVETTREALARRSGLTLPEVTTIREAVTAAADYHPFRFTALPPELRSKIYTILLPPDAQDPGRTVSVAETRKWKAKIMIKPQRYPISQTCRQLRDEALAAYFSTCTLSIRVSKHGDVKNQEWLQDQDDKALASLRRLEFLHSSNIDHGMDQHFTTLLVDMLKGGKVSVRRDATPDWARCTEVCVVGNVVARLQAVLDEVETTSNRGRKRLSKVVLGQMIRVASNLCVSTEEMSSLQVVQSKIDC
ncbi:hypothetical protein Slin14017_G035580 [Septoria linicola]|nr:hypothetical protein Slin14017_G035580 [Septoria linicola]